MQDVTTADAADHGNREEGVNRSPLGTWEQCARDSQGLLIFSRVLRYSAVSLLCWNHGNQQVLGSLAPDKF